MATSFDVIIDRAMTTMRDYKLDRIYEDMFRLHGYDKNGKRLDK